MEAFRRRSHFATVPGDRLYGLLLGSDAGQCDSQQALAGSPVAARTSENSIALKFLESGVLAFIGCTGTHYSPTEPPYDYFGGPIHSLFWDQFMNKQKFESPAKALFEAKKVIVLGIPHAKTGPLAEAIERKIVRQYTCLGLGW